MSFDSIPILDLAQARDASTKPAFLLELRHAVLEVGFLYIKNTGVDDRLIQDVITEGKKFFDLPTDKKLEVEMKNAPSFLGMPITASVHKCAVKLSQIRYCLALSSVGFLEFVR